MRILLDTNILCRISQPSHPSSLTAAKAIEELRRSGHELRLVPQVLYEYWVVATRPATNNGLGLSVQQTVQQLEMARGFFPLLLDERGIIRGWERLVVQHSVLGKGAHDARLVAAMQRHGLDHILTFNTADFARYSSVNVLDPQSVASH